MRFRYVLYLIFPLSVSCNIKQPEQVSNALKARESVERVVSAQTSLKRLDDGVEIIAMTKEWADKMGLMISYQVDPGFAKWCIIFHDIPGSPPYSFQQKRLLQSLPDSYYVCGPSSESILEAKNRKRPMSLIVSARGYLPGEKVVIRLTGKDAYKEAIFYPRPLLLKKKSGEVLAKGTLLSAHPESTLYAVAISGVGKQEKYKMVSRSGEEVLSQDLEGPVECSLMPGILGSLKGIGKMELHLEDGVSYTMELPWGQELVEYGLGHK